MPELSPYHHDNLSGDEPFRASSSSSSLQIPSHSYLNSQSYVSYPCNLIYKDYNGLSIMAEPSLQGLTETEVFIGEEENFLEEDESHLEGVAQSSLIINYHKDNFLHPLNSVKEDIEAEAAEEMSGNFHSLDYLGLSAGGSSLSSSVISSMSLDEVSNCNAGAERHCVVQCKYHQVHGSAICCPHHIPVCKDSHGNFGPCDKNISICKVKHAHLSNSSGKLSPASRVSPNLVKNTPSNNVTKEEISSCKFACCRNTPHRSGHSVDGKSKPSGDRKNPVWHNPSKSDKILSTKKESSSLLKRYGFCRAKSESKDSPCDSKFSSLPRKKKEKNEKDIAAETYGTLGKNRKTKETNNSSNQIPKSQNNERQTKDLTHDSKNILDKYATLPRKKAKELSSRWREQCNVKEVKETRPTLQRSKSAGKGETSRSTRTTPSPSFSSSSTPGVNSPRVAPSASKQTTSNKLTSKVISPAMRLLAKQNHGAGKEKMDKSPSPKSYSSSSHPRLTKPKGSKKNVMVQVNIPWDSNENELEEKLRNLVEENSLLQSRLRNAEANAEEVEQMRMEAVELRRTAENERLEKEELQEELDRTSGKVKEMLTSMDGVEKEFNNRGESLIELETQLQTSSDFNVKMQDKLNQYEEYTVKLRKDLEKSLAAQKILLQQVQDLEAEGREMSEFMAEEKNSLAECLREAELELCRQRKEIEELRGRLHQKEEEARHMVRLAEERRRGYVSLQTELKSVQASAEDMMVCQGAQVSEASIGLTNLTSRLHIITGKLIQDYTISENDIESVVTPVDSDSSISSSTTGTPDLQKSPVRCLNRSSSPRKPVSFMQSFLNAMRIAHISSRHTPVATDEVDNTKVVDDRKSPDGSEHKILLRPEAKVSNGNGIEPSSQSLSDQVTEVDYLLTRFMKVCCVLKSDADNILSELEDENERLCSQIQLQQQMIDQQYAEFESLSALESNARKELKLITKDLEFANATLNKVCDDDTKMQAQTVEEALREINLNLNRMDAMHAEKKGRLSEARHTLPIALGPNQNRLESPSGKRKMQPPSHSRLSRCKNHRRNGKDKENEEDEVNCNFKEEKEEKETELDFVVNHVLKTLETVPDIVSASSSLKNLYLHLSASNPFDKDVNCNPNMAPFSSSSPSANTKPTSNYLLECNSTKHGSEDVRKDGCNGRIPVSSSEDSIAASSSDDTLVQASPSSTTITLTGSPRLNGNGVAINYNSHDPEPVNGVISSYPSHDSELTENRFNDSGSNNDVVGNLHSYDSESVNGSLVITVDCNANPEISVPETPHERALVSSASASVPDPIKLIPLLTNETSI